MWRISFPHRAAEEQARKILLNHDVSPGGQPGELQVPDSVLIALGENKIPFTVLGKAASKPGQEILGSPEGITATPGPSRRRPLSHREDWRSTANQHNELAPAGKNQASMQWLILTSIVLALLVGGTAFWMVYANLSRPEDKPKVEPLPPGARIPRTDWQALELDELHVQLPGKAGDRNMQGFRYPGKQHLVQWDACSFVVGNFESKGQFPDPKAIVTDLLGGRWRDQLGQPQEIQFQGCEGWEFRLADKKNNTNTQAAARILLSNKQNPNRMVVLTVEWPKDKLGPTDVEYFFNSLVIREQK